MARQIGGKEMSMRCTLMDLHLVLWLFPFGLILFQEIQEVIVCIYHMFSDAKFEWDKNVSFSTYRRAWPVSMNMFVLIAIVDLSFFQVPYNHLSMHPVTSNKDP